jgi:hypothetical protein
MPIHFGNKYVKGITQFIPANHFGTLDFIDYHAAAAGMTRAQWMATYGSAMVVYENDKKPGPDTYMKDLDKEEQEDKEEQIKKQADMADDDPDAYKEMPGDKEAREKGKVKTSTHTKKYHELYGDKDETNEADDTQSTDRGPLDDEAIETALKTKAEESGVPIGIIRAVMRRGLAAWKSGHRPGANQQQWGYARVNAFLTKGEGTWGDADSDLAKEVRDGGYDKNMKS